MSRKPIKRELPPLIEEVPDFKGFPDNVIKLDALLRILRKIATLRRRSRSKPFYSVREVAGFFGLSVSGVVKVYQKLEEEGLLIRRRSSMTELAPLKGYKRIIHRGVVAIPIWLPGFVTYRECRRFHIELEKELINFGFVPNLIFYRQAEEVEPDFARQVLAHKPDYAVWLRPALSDSITLEMLGDAGVRLVVLGESPEHRFRGQHYLMLRENSLRDCFTSWKKAGIRSLLMPVENGERRSNSNFFPGLIAESVGLKCIYLQPGRKSLSEYVSTLAAYQDAGVAFDEDLWHSALCLQAPQQIGAMLKRTRAILTHPVNIAPIHLQGATVDTVLFDWRSIARRIARDLDTGAVFTSSKQIPFEAEWSSHVDASTVGIHLHNM